MYFVVVYVTALHNVLLYVLAVLFSIAYLCFVGYLVSLNTVTLTGLNANYEHCLFWISSTLKLYTSIFLISYILLNSGWKARYLSLFRFHNPALAFASSCFSVLFFGVSHKWMPWTHFATKHVCVLFLFLQSWHCLVALGVSCLDCGGRVSNRAAVLTEETSEYDS